MAQGRPAKPIESQPDSGTSLDKVSREVQSNQSKLSMVLGALIILVVGVLVFNYFNKSKVDLGPSQQTEQILKEDVSPENLPGKYTVKEGDTLYLIAEKYYKDGFKYTEIVKANNLTDENTIEVGQVLEIPKIEGISPSPTPSFQPSEEQIQLEVQPGQKGAPTQVIPTQFGPPITSNTYTVAAGDWLSKIAARAYGDIFAYKKLAEVNKIPNPDLIYPGQVLTIPR